MKVCIPTSGHPPFDTRIFHKQAKGLREAGYDVTLIAQHDKNEVVGGVKIVALPKAKNRFCRMLGTWRVFKQALKQKADVYHFHDLDMLPWGWLLHKIGHKPVIFDAHENYVDTILFKEWIPNFLRKPTALIVDRIVTTLARGVPAIITVTEPTKQRYSIYQMSCVCIHNFPDLEIVARASKSKESGRINDRYSIIHSGGTTKDRGFQTILDAMDLIVKRDSKLTCAVVGRGTEFSWLDEEHIGSMKRLIKDGNLKIIGEVPHDEVFQYLNASTIGWRPRLPYQDAMDVTVFEYMACGKPVVASDVPLIANIIRETKCGILVDPLDARAHASAILYLLEHPDEAQEMGRNGRRAVLEKYNWQGEKEKLLDLYRRLLAKG